MNQVDLRIGKRFDIRQLRFSTQVDVFNLLNANTVEAVRSFNYGVAGFDCHRRFCRRAS